MGTIFKALLKSLKDKKARTLLLIFSISISAALIYANESFSRVCEQKFYNADVRTAGNSDIRISVRNNAGSGEWIDINKLSKYDMLFKYEYQFIKEKALFAPSIEKMHYFTIIGADINEFNSYNPIELKYGNFKAWNGFKAIIGPAYAEKYNLKINESLKLELNKKVYSFKIVAISKPNGIYTRELADGGYIIVPKTTLSMIFPGGSNQVFIKLKDSSLKEAMKDKLTKELNDYQVDYGIYEALIKAETDNYVMPFKIAAIAVVFMSVFIIFTAFNLITRERIPLIGTLRSIGCNRKKINRLLITESAFFGAFGGLIGCIMGIGVLKIIISIYFSEDEATLNSVVHIFSDATLKALLAAIVITTLSSIVPILRITKTPIKNIILNDTVKKERPDYKLWVLGIILMTICGIVPRFLDTNFKSMIIGCIISTGALIGIIPLVPFLTHQLSKFIEKIPFLSYSIVLGFRNIKDNKSLSNNIKLFSVAIAIVAFMSSIFNSMTSDLIKAYDRDTKYDIELVLRHSDKQTLNTIKNINGVSDIFGVFMTDADLRNHQTYLNMVYGITSEKFFEFYKVKELDKNREAIRNLNNGRNIITTNILKDKLGLKMGDKMIIGYGSKEVAYKVTGFIETNLGIGSIGFISTDNYKKDLNVSDYSSIYVKTSLDPVTIKNNLLRAFTKDIMSIYTKEELKTANSDKVIPMFRAINVYSYIALLVGLLGIINNLIASFLDRKRNLAMLRSIGMSRRDFNRMLVTEAVAVGFLGIFFGMGLALVMSQTIPSIVGIFWGKVSVMPAFREMAIIGLAGIGAMLLIASVPVSKNNKLSLIESIKYE